MSELVNKSVQTPKVNCPNCGGAKTINNEKCSTCNGTGQVNVLNG